MNERTVHRTVLNNGIVVLVVENPTADIVAARIFNRAGQWVEPWAKAGLTHLASAVLTKGTAQRSSREIAEAVESVGAALSAEANPDYFLLSLKTVSSDFAAIFSLAAELLRYPAFPVEEVELERKLTLQAIRSQREQPFAVAFDQLRQALYAKHPYALSGLGNTEGVQALTHEDLKQYHATWFRPDQTVISIVGRITPEVALAQVEAVFGDWQVPAEPVPTLQLSQPKPQNRWQVTPQDTQQSIVMLGYLAPPVRSPDFCAFKLASTYLGNGLSSRLFVELREKRGLAYEVSAFYPTRLEPSQFGTYMGTAPSNTEIALDGLRSEVERLAEQPLSPEELQAARSKLLGQYALGKQTNAQIAQVLGWYEVLGLGLSYDELFPQMIEAVTAADIQAAVQRYCQSPVVSLVGPAAAVEFNQATA
ncbi:pitrilysin family protein [Leptolyngbya sp. FACHB-261]|uniref:M16 family metallopeptidase n=1 Tax=Leptolyngbya sp. FACHB-261 TaxID=2692806 RepID=UPI001688A0E3|nr:insulinase family protein [Leptolyngbya sp. FACHB-261]MBD2099512.1 insulinase family protein [Leptolyngbya sp. FACHB-261]